MTKTINLESTAALPDKVLVPYMFTEPDDAAEKYRIKWGHIAKVVYVVRLSSGKCHCYIPFEQS